jgi:hypothetical protein
MVQLQFIMLVEVEVVHTMALRQQCLVELVVKVVEELVVAQNEDNFPADLEPQTEVVVVVVVIEVLALGGAGGGGGKGIVIVSY